jgi:hypothetical protein
VPFKLLGDEAKGCAHGTHTHTALAMLRRWHTFCVLTRSPRVLSSPVAAYRWLDTSYLSERVRISKGNKGTTFILCRYDGE